MQNKITNKPGTAGNHLASGAHQTFHWPCEGPVGGGPGPGHSTAQ